MAENYDGHERMHESFPSVDSGNEKVPLPKPRPSEAGLSSADYDTYGLNKKDYSRGLQFRFPGFNK